MKKKAIPAVEIRALRPGLLHGCTAQTTAAALRQAIPSTSDRFHKIVDFQPGRILPLYVLTRDFDPASGSCTLFVGSEKPHEGLEAISMPGGPYARMVIRPKYGLFWSKAILEAKNWFYQTWLPASAYRSSGLEFELHSENTVGKQPTLELFFALEKKA